MFNIYNIYKYLMRIYMYVYYTSRLGDRSAPSATMTDLSCLVAYRISPLKNENGKRDRSRVRNAPGDQLRPDRPARDLAAGEFRSFVSPSSRCARRVPLPTPAKCATP